MLRAAAAHPGAALIEIYQNCPVFNDGAFDALTEKRDARGERRSSSSTAQPIRFGAERERGVVRGARRRAARSSMSRTSARTRCCATTPTARTRASRSRSADSAHSRAAATPIGIFRAVAAGGAARRARGRAARTRRRASASRASPTLLHARRHLVGRRLSAAAMALDTTALGRTFEPHSYAVGREKIREFARAVGETDPLLSRSRARRAPPGIPDLVAPPMFAVVYCASAIEEAMFDPAVGIDFEMLRARRPGVRVGPARARRRRDHHARRCAGDIPSGSAWPSTSSHSRSANQRGERGLRRAPGRRS